MNKKDSTHGGVDTSLEFLRSLAEAGVDDVHLLSQETAERVLTEKRMELLREIESGEVESVSDLARRVERDKSIVSRDLDVLYEAEVVDFEEGEGRAKRPVLAHENILVEPIAFAGHILSNTAEDEVPT